MDTIFMNSGNSKASDPQRLLLKLLDKINMKPYFMRATTSYFTKIYFVK